MGQTSAHLTHPLILYLPGFIPRDPGSDKIYSTFDSGGSNSPWSEFWSEFPHFMGMGVVPAPSISISESLFVSNSFAAEGRQDRGFTKFGDLALLPVFPGTAETRPSLAL